MKSAQKIKIKKISLPLKKMTEREKDYVAAVLEDVNSNFMAFGEGLSFVRADVDVLKENFSSMKETLDFVRMKGDATFEETGRIRKELVLMNGRLDNIEREVVSIKNEINALKNILTQKADIEYLKKLEIRLARVENHLKLSVA